MSSTLRKDDKIIVVYGGDSAEREPSVRSGLAVYRALKRNGFINVQLFDFHGYRLGELLDARPDLVFIALHGRYGEDGCLQGALELAGIRYTGSGPAASAIFMDKALTKMFLDAARIPTPGYAVLEQEEYTDAECAFAMLAGQTRLPFLIKPASQGSGIGMIVDKVQGPMVLEVNTLPAMTETSALPAAAKAAGISMEELTERIAMSAMRQPPSASIAEATSLLQQRCF